MKIIFLALPFAIALCPAIAAAQTDDSNSTLLLDENKRADVKKDAADIKKDSADIAKDKADLKGDQKQGKDLEQDRNAAFKTLDAKEKAAADAIRDDKSLTPEQKKDKLAALREQTKKQRDAIQDKFVADKKALNSDEKKDRADVRKDRRDMARDRRDMQRDRRDARRDRREARSDRRERGKR